MDPASLTVLAAALAVLVAGTAMRNLARRRKAEARLLEVSRRNERLLDALPIGLYIYRCSPGGKLVLTWANAGADRILGVEHAELVGKPLEEAFPNLAGTEVPQRYRQIAETGGSWHTDRLQYQDDRCVGIFEVHAFQLSPGEVAVAFTDVTHRWRMHDTLQEYYFLNDAIVQGSPVGIAAIDRDRRFMLWNPACERIFGWKAEEVLGKPLDLLLPESHRHQACRLVELGFAGEGACDVEGIRRRKDGSLVPVNLSTAPLYDAKGEVLGVMALVLDLSARKAAEKECRITQARWQRLVETAQEGVWMADAAGAVTFVNDELAGLLGYSRPEVIGRHVLEFVAPQCRQQAAKAFEDLKSGLRQRLELILQSKNGGYIAAIVSACGDFDEEDRFVGALGLVTRLSGRDLPQTAEPEEQRRQPMPV